ncbi:hypothetical protein B0T16DRAFT_6215 [Cercophora newfieldiana]|uniref:Uncharacterized protein n=1 Tax=Cercophora newfieldiana TaxID=92897 RepID=A0AA40CYH5_9PEZI|nr:hypothetical protein B0T16DRAFT_6215 [Cercophora newfieldiana]
MNSSNISTSQHLNISTSQHLNISTSAPRLEMHETSGRNPLELLWRLVMLLGGTTVSQFGGRQAASIPGGGRLRLLSHQLAFPKARSLTASHPLHVLFKKKQAAATLRECWGLGQQKHTAKTMTHAGGEVGEKTGSTVQVNHTVCLGELLQGIVAGATAFSGRIMPVFPSNTKAAGRVPVWRSSVAASHYCTSSCPQARATCCCRSRHSDSSPRSTPQ